MRFPENDQIRQILALQLGASIIIALLLYAYGEVYAWSGMIGGLIATASNGFSAIKSFARYRAQEPDRLVARLYGAEIQKLLLAGIMFALTFVFVKPLSVAAFLGCYLVVSLGAPLVMLMFIDKRQLKVLKKDGR